jgi:hypothetical protein
MKCRMTARKTFPLLYYPNHFKFATYLEDFRMDWLKFSEGKGTKKPPCGTRRLLR